MGDLCVVGIDIGTQGTKAALYSEEGCLLTEAFQPSNLVRPTPGHVEEDPERQLESVCATIRECIEKSGVDPSAVHCIAIDGQMAGVIGVGHDGMAVTPYDSWLDTRCSAQVDRMKAQAGTAVLEKTGNAPSFNHGPKILWWKENHSDLFAAIAAFVQPGGYAAMRLCGLNGSEAFIDNTYLHFSGFADNAAGSWDRDLCMEFGLAPACLPRICNPADMVGRLTEAMATRCGLRAGIPVAAGCGDTAASFLSCGAVEPGVCVDVAGTASVFASTTDRFVPDRISGIMGVGRSAIKGLWHPYAYINGGGMNILWFSSRIAPGIASGGHPIESVDYDDLDSLIRGLTPNFDDPFFVPHMEGRVAPNDAGIRGAWAGIKRDHGLDRLYRAVLESVAFEYSLYLEAIRKLEPNLAIKEMRVTGGGVKSNSWNALKSDILGLPLFSVTGSGGAPMGSAIIAAVASGLAPNPAELARSWLSFKPVAVPTDRNEEADIYRRRLDQYKYLLQALSGFPAGRV